MFSKAFPNIQITENGKTVEARPQFPFEVEMWSYGVTIFQCSTGLDKLFCFSVLIFQCRTIPISTL